MTEILREIANDYLALTVFVDASAEVRDRRSGLRWRMGPVALQEEGPIDVGHVWLRAERSLCEEFPGRFRGEAVGDRLWFTLLGRERRPLGDFLCTVDLEGPWVVYRLLQIDEALPSLVFPPPFEAEALVLPIGVGRLVRKPLEGRYFWQTYFRLNMRWFGGLRGEHGWLAVLDEGFTDAGVLATGLSAAPGWLKSLGRWTAPRSVRYRFIGGGYVGLAKAYRAWVIERGLFKSLRDKMEECPALRNLHGGRIFSFTQASPVLRREHLEDCLCPLTEELEKQLDKVQVKFTHADAVRLVNEARGLGMEKGLVILRGWINGGYDGSHPDVWPPEPALGSVEELAELCALDGSLTVALHDNYQDIYEHVPSWPRGVNRLIEGRPMPGGIWGFRQAYILNSREALGYARRNWENIRRLKPRAMFIDTTTAAQLYQSYEPGNTLTRAEDLECKLA